jgi:hypothetical protein
MITKWAARDQWVEWKLAVPADGRYLLAFKYCTGDEDARRAVTLDGTPVGELAFPKTGGFSTNQDNWRHMALGGDEKPTLLDLKAGEHRLRMDCLSGGLGLDYIVLRPE